MVGKSASLKQSSSINSFDLKTFYDLKFRVLISSKHIFNQLKNVA